MKRRTKNQAKPCRREEHVEETYQRAEPLAPKTQAQAEYIQALETRPYVFCSGYAGTGKTYIAARVACQQLKQRKIERIVLLRPAASASKSLGFFKGTHEEKMRQWLAPILGALAEEFSPSELKYLMKEGVERLVFCPLETAKGNSWKDAFVIIDEGEDCTFAEIKTLVTRLGTNSTMAFCGDITQVDIRNSGMTEFLQKCENSHKLSKVVSHIAFDDYSDIVRSRAVKAVIEGLDEVA